MALTMQADRSSRHAFVTSASCGLGRHFVEVLAGCGVTITVAVRRTEALDALVRDIESGKGQAFPVALDVSDTGTL